MRFLRLLAFFLSFSCAWSARADQPNVLLILVDDLKPVAGVYGDPIAQTPNIDTLANSGMRFDRAYCNQAVCAPSRFTLMLGSHSTSTGLYGLGSNLRDILPNAVTIPQYFAKNGGYRTESLGKVFHIGHGNLGDPDSFSVPHFKEKVIEYVDPASTHGGQLTREEAFFTNQKLGEINSLPRGAAFESPDVEDEAYADGRVAAEAIKRLRAAKERREKEGTPFFIAAGFARPHLPFSAPKKYWDLYDPDKLPIPEHEDLPVGAPEVAGKRGGEIRNYFPVPDKGDPAQISNELKRQLIHGYYASTSFVDAQIGKVTQALDDLGLADDTIVVLWGDHGFHLGDLGIWTKHTNYEQANRIPLLIRAPGVTTAGMSSGALVESVDIFPTLAELAGLPAPKGPQPIDGQSLVPLLRGEDAESAGLRNHAYHAYPKGKIGRAIRTERYRMVEWKIPGSPDVTAEYELYDYEKDPLETRNLAGELPEILAELRKILSTYPEALPQDGKRKEQADTNSFSDPEIAEREIAVTVEVKSADPQGVVVAQGGRENGYALHFAKGKPVFDVRVNGKLYSLTSKNKGQKKGALRVEASLDKDGMHLSVDGEPVADTIQAPFIPRQPKDGLSVGRDTLSAAGNYDSPNPFNGTILYTNVSSGGEPPPVATPPKPVAIRKALAAHDKAVLVLNHWIRDPYITRGPDGIFYLTGTTPNPGDEREQSDPYNSGLGYSSLVGWQAQVWKSEDLAKWESMGTPFTLKDGIWYQEKPTVFEESDPGQWRLWAPELHWIEDQDRWALVHTSPPPMPGSNLSLTKGKDIAGPWENPFGMELKKKHDPSLFRDDDGTWWMVWGATSIAPLKPDFSGFSADPIEIRPSGDAARMGHEGCLILKIEGKYVLFGTGWSTGEMRRGSYNLYYATSNKIEGPYSQRKFAGRFLGHGTPFQDNEGRWWCTAFYNANTMPMTADGIQTTDLGDTARTINQRGTTLVPMEVKLLDGGELSIRAKDPAYAVIGPDEAQHFGE